MMLKTAAREGFILLVEDNPSDEVLALRALKKSKISNPVVVVRDGVEALDYFFGTGVYQGRDLSVMPLVTLLDLKLPKIDGFEVLRRVRSDSRTSLLRIVVLTSSRERQDIIAAYKLGANSYVHKPVNFDVFAKAVHQLGAYWIALNEPPPATY